MYSDSLFHLTFTECLFVLIWLHLSCYFNIFFFPCNILLAWWLLSLSICCMLQSSCTVEFYWSNCTSYFSRWITLPCKVKKHYNRHLLSYETFLWTGTEQQRYSFGFQVHTPESSIFIYFIFIFFLPPSALCHPWSPQGIMLHCPLCQIIPYCALNMSLPSAWGWRSFCFHSIITSTINIRIVTGSVLHCIHVWLSESGRCTYFHCDAV